MAILNFGSLNIDYVYRVDRFVQPGETKSSTGFMVNSGGKGLNQSIAAARAGAEVFHSGLLGRDGAFLAGKLKSAGVDLSLMEESAEVSGHAIIQVDDAGQNCILLYGGTNRMLTEEYIDLTLARFGSRGLVLLQNETNLVGYIIARAHELGLQTALNAAPMNPDVQKYPLGLLDWLIINEIEGRGIAACDRVDDILPCLEELYPHTSILLTLGRLGARCLTGGRLYTIGSYQVEAVDTTAAGDTFTGYFLSAIQEGKEVDEALGLATAASALCVQGVGAADSIPSMVEVLAALQSGSLGKVMEI